MTVPGTPPTTDTSNSKLIRIAIWVAIGALIAAALVCVVWVLVGTANGIIGRAFLTILLLAAFAGVAILDTHLAPRRPSWFALTSMIVWVVTLLIGAVMIWMPDRSYAFYDSGFTRFFSFLLIVLILQLGVLHVRLFHKAWTRNRTRFIDVVAIVTIILVALLALMLVFPLMLNEYIRFHDIYWRLVVAIAILAAVGTALVPLVNALFAPKRPRPAAHGPAWPTFVDGVTPLPVLPNGNPDWNAYYTGYPSPGARILALPGAAPGSGHPVALQQPAMPAAPAQVAPQPASSPVPPQQLPPQQVASQPPVAPQQSVPPAQPPVPPQPGYSGYPPPPAPPQ